MQEAGQKSIDDEWHAMEESVRKGEVKKYIDPVPLLFGNQRRNKSTIPISWGMGLAKRIVLSDEGFQKRSDASTSLVSF